MKLKEVFTDRRQEGSGLWFTLIKTQVQNQMFIIPKPTEMIKRKYFHRGGKKDTNVMSIVKKKKKV